MKKILIYAAVYVALYLVGAFFAINPHLIKETANFIANAWCAVILLIIAGVAVSWAWERAKIKGIALLIGGSCAVIGCLFFGLRYLIEWLHEDPEGCWILSCITCFFIGGLVGSKTEARQ